MSVTANVYECDAVSEKPFSIAKMALFFISKFRTPPIPEVYEVWYHYAAGESDLVSEQLNYAINDLKEVSVDRLCEIRQQFLFPREMGEINHHLTSKLDSLSMEMQRTIDSKRKTIDNFESQLGEAYSSFKDVQPQEGLMGSLLKLMNQTSDVHSQISEMSIRLGESSTELAKLREQVEELRKSVFTDPLTEVGNRRKFDHEIETIFNSRSDVTSKYLVMIDLDNFKTINDTFGHGFGDESLQYVARSIQLFMPESKVCRLGGDEFAAIASITTEEAIEISQDLCNYLSKNSGSANLGGGTNATVTISGGAALLRKEDSADSWKARADKLLYNAKAAGRQQIFVEREGSRLRNVSE